MLISIAVAAIILGVLIIVHEAGHFFMAKRLGVRVLRFSIGYPPKLFGFRRGETEYAIGATPFGGYVRMLGDEVGEDPKAEELGNYLREIGYDILEATARHGQVAVGSTPDERLKFIAEKNAPGASAIGRDFEPEEALLLNEIRATGSLTNAIGALCANPPAALLESFRARAFPTQSLYKRVLIVLAGPLANIIFAPILLAFIFMYGVPVLVPIVGEAKANLPAYAAGLRPGDRIVAINGQPASSWSDFADTVRASGGAALKLDIERKKGSSVERQSLVIKPAREEQKTVYGTMAAAWIIGVLPRGDEFVRRLDPVRATSLAVVSAAQMSGELVVGLASIVSGATPVRQALGGPIMIAQMAGREAHRGLASVVLFTVMLSLELGIINLLPVPLLDGGHLAFFAVEGLRGRPLELRYREMALQVGLFLLVALMAFVIFNDISRIVQG
ncbi:MAG TPA: site-2 protease family protein [Candidatus Binataceae bacterium]